MAIQSYSKTITPKMAEDFLTSWNIHNRPIKNKRVDQYAADMAAGKWRENGEPIIFGKSRLLDGQHRLWACVQSGSSFKTLITEGVSDDTFDTIDVGAPRTAGDILAIADYGKNAKTLAAAATLCIEYRAGTLGDKMAVPKHEIKSFVESNTELVEWVSRARGTKGWIKNYAPPLAALLYLGAFKYRAKAEEFIDGISTGENLQGGSPILALRNKLGTEKLMRKEARFAMFIVAWNAFVKDRHLTKIQAIRSDREKGYPEISGARRIEKRA